MALRPGDAEGRLPLCAEDAGMLGLEPPQLWIPDEGKVPALRRPDGLTELWLFDGSGLPVRGEAQLTGGQVDDDENATSGAKKLCERPEASLVVGAPRNPCGCSVHADRR